jgi:putative thioredoxin
MNASKPSSPWIIDVTDADFSSQVLERSATLPVVVDFWAAWCGPCRMLGPVLEQLAIEYDGKFLLAKADTEAAPQAAAQFGVQSIPAVFGVRDGQVRDGFLGALPAGQIRAWLDQLLPSAAELLVSEAEEVSQSAPELAEEKYRLAMSEAPNLAEAPIGLARLLIRQQREPEAAGVLEQLEARGFLEPEAEKLKAMLTIGQQAAGSGGVSACREALACHPDDADLQLQLARALAAEQHYEEALGICLSLVQRDRQQFGEPARQVMVDIFRLLPDDSELTSRYRRKLSAALF